MTSVQLRVAGMDCASCAAAVERALKRIDGVKRVDVDVVGGIVSVGYEGSVAQPDLEGAVMSAGYRVLVADPAHDARESAASFWARRGRSLMTISSGLALGIALLAQALAAARPVTLVLLGVATIAGGWFVVPRGLKAAFNLALDMNFLMSIAATGAWIIGERTEAAATLFLFAVAEWLESFSMDRARNAIKALMDLSPAEGTVLLDGREKRVPISEIVVGDIVVVRPGEKIPVDGEVTQGRSSANQAPITGESMPVDKQPGTEVYAGSLNVQGALQVKATKAASDSTLARIIHAVEEAQASRAPSQTFVERFARIYTPAVVLIAAGIAIAPPLLGVGEWGTWIYRALAMLVVACPCALVISTPVSIVSGLTGAARAGVLIKGGAHLEHAGSVTAVCFDKTGTLTEGRPAVTDVIALTGGENEVLRFAVAVERHSEHPLARSILEHGEKGGVEVPHSEAFEALFGRGAKADVGDETVFVGNERLMKDLGLAPPKAKAILAQSQSDGKTEVIVMTKTRVLGIIAIADRIRDNAAPAIEALRRNGIRRTIMLTGDNTGAARAVAALAGVDEFLAELLPDDKVRLVRELEAKGQKVAFVGDGVNDAPALAAATVGIAMGAAGTDVALETADIALMGDDLLKLPYAIRLSRRTLSIVKQNITVSLAIKAVFLVLAVGGWATLWMAVAADMGGSLLVVGNGRRARNMAAW